MSTATSSSVHLSPHLVSESDPSCVVAASTDSFDIQDFTTATEWERFEAALQKIIREWGIDGEARNEPQSPGSKGRWRAERRSVAFVGFEFCVTRHTFVREGEEKKKEERAKLERRQSLEVDPETGIAPIPACLEDMMRPDHDFPPQAHPVHYFYGLYDFVVVGPAGKEDVDNPTRARMALGTVTVSVSETGCRVPFFVQVMERGAANFIGVLSTPHYRTNFEMAVLPRRLKTCQNLSELLRVFKDRLDQPVTLGEEIMDCRCSVRQTFRLEDWTSHAWTQSPPDLELFAMFGGSLGYVNDIRNLPFGANRDPVKRLSLSVTWPDQHEGLITEDDLRSDLDPDEAPQWAVAIEFDDNPTCLLGEYLAGFLALCHNKQSLRQVLGADFIKGNTYETDDADPNLDKLPSALSKLTGPSYGLTDIIRSGRASVTGEGGASPAPEETKKSGPIKDKYLRKILDYLFPDASDSSEFPYPDELASSSLPHASVSLSGVKSCPVDGLVWRLTVTLAHCLHVLGGVRPVAHLLHEFLLEVRHRWETASAIPGLPPGTPDSSYCLFHQKLQMVNCCIERKKARERREAKGAATSKSDDDASDDEFFDCDEEASSETTPTSASLWQGSPEGRLRKHQKLRLLEKPDEWLYLPRCQEPPPMTEDQLAEQAEVMVQLGDDSEGSEARAKMQSASLLSDMESFKAANPGAVLGDFVRWYSPRDWIEESEGGEAKNEGKLSTRMEVPGNPWLEAWTNAKPVPAHRQKRLFDDTREAEKVLEYLTGLRPGEAAQLLTPVLLHSAVDRILKEDCDSVPHVEKNLKDTASVIATLSRLPCPPEVLHYSSQRENPDFDRRGRMVSEAARRLAACEAKVSQALSLREKFVKDFQSVKENAIRGDEEDAARHMTDFVRELTLRAEVPVIGAGRGHAGQLIRRMFLEAKKSLHMISDDFDGGSGGELDPFPEPHSREYILRKSTSRPFPYSHPSPQRIYCCIRRDMFRLAGAFTVDKQYL